MSAPTQENVVLNSTTIKAMAEIEIGVHLGLQPGDQMDVLPLIRKDYDRQGHVLKTGALVLDCEVTDAAGLSRPYKRIEIDKEHRPFSEQTIEYYGAEAVSKQEIGEFISRIVL